ncbi:DgyrCDS7864 [Dimorphilus gyrociliatus]|uniref:DgyrCDS7864 n=1 Tax=Dimorphilus gyrociliatus TaxID=2664684 RepID=A0A7I8VSI8_9ANNE|nr:DgyrCDS7864 [Dimorphilus gyrociliatus]
MPKLKNRETMDYDTKFQYYVSQLTILKDYSHFLKKDWKVLKKKFDLEFEKIDKFSVNISSVIGEIVYGRKQVLVLHRFQLLRRICIFCGKNHYDVMLTTLDRLLNFFEDTKLHAQVIIDVVKHIGCILHRIGELLYGIEDNQSKLMQSIIITRQYHFKLKKFMSGSKNLEVYASHTTLNDYDNKNEMLNITKAGEGLKEIPNRLNQLEVQINEIERLFCNLQSISKRYGNIDLLSSNMKATCIDEEIISFSSAFDQFQTNYSIFKTKDINNINLVKKFRKVLNEIDNKLTDKLAFGIIELIAEVNSDNRTEKVFEKRLSELESFGRSFSY